MSQFRHLTDTMSASPQITPGDVAAAAEQGIALIINNRPDGEDDGQPSGAEIEAAAHAAGIAYRAIPVSGGGFGEPQVNAMIDALQSTDGPVLAYCRSGTRSTLLWSLAQAKLGMSPDDIAAAARAAGYDVAPVRGAIDMLHAGAQSGS
ncbi:TIGR01244 family sulfur transferase [Altererythrobacter sp. H2]|uniref:TIGR01244 family sulfur transferase n=1 Tax=Altererythrobacter sp. H2 TaxID=3108391 RepID=UPI002B4BC4D9|nr:TIGR01244 family sulfur transferase [Altererythrobacter sp. H2]WRK96318.1 TIGR01244 family sulfur transferase [Altererythrobacter sp. H2]